jgi:geranylgeranyl diphosphate synthase type II
VNEEIGYWLDMRRQTVDAALGRFLPAAPAAPEILAEAMRYSVMAGGKRLRPLLVLASAEAVAVRLGFDDRLARDLALPAACAIELIHTYSLVHDDLPAMDNDTLRRGRPTAHVVFGEGQAILSGDALHTEAFALMSREPRRGASGVSEETLSTRKLQAIEVVAEAAGALGMAGGQALDLQAAAPGASPLDQQALRAMHERKTGALIRASAMAGALMAGATPDLLQAADGYGAQLGLAFQIVDDILDVEGASAQLGKTPGKDSAAGKPTYPSTYGLEESRRLAATCIDRALAILAGAGLSGQLPAIARWVAGRTN